MLRNGVMIVIALMSGGFIGVIVTCCMVAAKKSDEDLGGMMKEEEKKEQQILRREYVDAFKRNLCGQLNNISIKEKDGSITNLGEKYGQKKGN